MDEFDVMGPVEMDIMADLDYQDVMSTIGPNTRVAQMGGFEGGW